MVHTVLVLVMISADRVLPRATLAMHFRVVNFKMHGLEGSKCRTGTKGEKGESQRRGLSKSLVILMMRRTG